MPSTSSAHFVLTSPPSMYEQNALGDPQKAPPCGDQGNAMPTGVVTEYQGGDTITVTIDETIFHPGHYRIALALDDGIFPEEPPVTPGSTDCGSAPIDPAPAFPVLADGVWVHTEAFGGSQTIDITLPEDLSCSNCTLQVIQFMSNHGLNDPGGCYYHHCASISVTPIASGSEGTTAPSDESGGDSSDDGPQVTTGADDTAGPGETGSDPDDGGSSTGTTPTTAASETDTTPASDDEEGGCSCRAPAGGTQGGLGMLLGLLGLAALRRRRA